MPTKGHNPRGHRRIWDNKTRGIDITEKPSRSEHSWQEWDDLADEEVYLNIYTDGASNEIGSGYAFAAYEKGQIEPLYTENKALGRSCAYQAELYAIRAALEWLSSNPHRLKK